MRKTILFACAAVLTSAVALTSCKKDGQNEPKKPVEVVKTEFAIALPSQLTNGVKRMPGATVQVRGSEDFQGMKNLVLIPFAKTTAIVAGDTRLGATNITLSDIAASGEGSMTNQNAKVYSDKTIPVTTASFLFYGESAITTGTDFQKGKLSATGIDAGAVNGIHFDLAKVLGEKTIGGVTGSGTKGEKLLAYLNSLISVTDGTAKTWAEYDPNTISEAAMAGYFSIYTSNHALSSFEVARLMSDLYANLEATATAVADSPSKTLAINLRTAIASDTYAASVVANVVTLQDDMLNFPTEDNLPVGAVRVKYVSGSHQFQACTEAEYTAANQIPLDKYTYPASLWYYANSTIKAANESKSALYVDGNNWESILAGYGSCPTIVSASTRSVALVNPIQYSVARFDVKVRLSAGTLKDAKNNDINCDSYPVTAVIVGNQRQVKFDFTPNTEAAAYTIYDNEVTLSAGTDAFVPATPFNSTLVLETPNTLVAGTDNVQIAIELTNASGSDFVGAGNQIVPNGGTFYLVTTLSAAEATQTSGKVFKQDYTTTAALTITSLAGARNTIPDLRVPQMEIGMSVDLTWQAGHTYEVNL